jgi:predicted Zn-dependent protease
LREALTIAPDNAAAHFALGLVLVRQHQLPDATAMLAEAAEQDPGNAHYTYVDAIALNSTGAQDRARHMLEASQTRHPADRETLAGLASLARDAGDQTEAARWTDLLSRLEGDGGGTPR